MNWEKWLSWKNKNLISVILFIVAYILTIPIRNYEFLNRFTDISQGVPILAHLVLIIIGIIVLLLLLELMAMIVRYFLKK